MNRINTLFLFTLLAAVGLTACSGLPQGTVCTVNCTVSGNATLSVTLQSKPLTPPPSTNLLSYNLTVGGATLTPATGNPINIPGPFTFDLTRLQSDSAFLGSVTLPSGTYTTLTLSLSGAEVTYCTVTAGVPGCTAGTVTQVSGGASAPVITFPNGGLVVTSSQQAGISVYFDMGGTLTVANQAISGINLTNGNLTTINLGPTHTSGLTSSQLDYLEDVTGNVTVNGNVVTIKTATYGSITATADSNTYYSPNCNLTGIGDGTNTINCVQNNQVASIDAILNADGTIELISYDPISAANTTNNDWIEGEVTYTPTNLAQFSIVANDADVSSTGSLLPSSFPIGSPVVVNLATGANAAIFGVDTQGLTVPADYTNFIGTLPATVLLPGQAVAVHVTSYSSTAGIVVTADAVELRFSRVAGTSATGGNNSSFSYSSNSLPPYFGFTNVNQLVELTSGTPPSTNSTYYDGITTQTNITSGLTYSVRALYFGQFDAFPFVAAKVRQNQ
jgi:hypothetical protein